ncbi:MAG TPA: nucleotidyltransferase domain-containing protein [Smithellaceae bacterium]|nr:nucleotidyltransferase domain-containing protein [Smithellaceae bacterium]
MVNNSVLNSVKKYLSALQENGITIKFGVIFGSQATGKSDTWSDIDLLVVSPIFDNQQRRDDINLLWRTAARIGNRIEPIPCGERQWVDDDASAMLEIARLEGELVALT